MQNRFDRVVIVKQNHTSAAGWDWRAAGRIETLFAEFLRGRRVPGVRLLKDDRGALLTEYTAVTGFVALVTIPALLYAGWALAASFGFVRNYVLYPFP